MMCRSMPRKRTEADTRKNLTALYQEVRFSHMCHTPVLLRVFLLCTDGHVKIGPFSHVSYHGVPDLRYAVRRESNINILVRDLLAQENEDTTRKKRPVAAAKYGLSLFTTSISYMTHRCFIHDTPLFRFLFFHQRRRRTPSVRRMKPARKFQRS